MTDNIATVNLGNSKSIKLFDQWWGSVLLTPAIFIFLLFVLFMIVSCKQECIDLCGKYGLVQEEDSCNCKCATTYTAFEVNGYVYCIRESETHDIYILENYNSLQWFSDLIEDCIPPPLFLSRIPKGLDTVPEFTEHTVDPPILWFLFEIYVQNINPGECRLYYSGLRAIDIQILWFRNVHALQAFVPWVDGHFVSVFELIRDNLFERKPGIGKFEFSEDLGRMTFYFLGYNNVNDMFYAYYTSVPDSLFQFPFIPDDPLVNPYNPLHKELVFKRLEF